MIWQQSLDEIRRYIERLERDLSDVDALVATHASAIDKSPMNEWPPGSILRCAVTRHETRKLLELSRRAETLPSFREMRGILKAHSRHVVEDQE